MQVEIEKHLYLVSIEKRLFVLSKVVENYRDEQSSTIIYSIYCNIYIKGYSQKINALKEKCQCLRLLFRTFMYV